MTDLFIYQGPCTLTDGSGHTVSLEFVKLWTEVADTYEEMHSTDATVHRYPIYEWVGQARIPGLVYRLLDVLGGEVTVTLPDGREGRAYVTGESVDSAWIIHIQGVGKPPQ